MTGIDRQALDALSRSCVECALCLPHCATYLATGDETLSPRGRLLLLREALRRPDGVDGSLHAALDSCLGCRACETACPSGVPFDLLAAGRDLAMAAAGPPDGPVVRQLASQPALRALAVAGQAARALLRAVLGRQWRPRLASGPLRRPARLLGALPTAPGHDRELIHLLDRLTGLCTPTRARIRPLPPAGRSAVLFAGCANAALLPGPQRRLRALLASAGVEVSLPPRQDCCGALAAHTGRPERARAQQAANVAALSAAVDAADVLLVEAAGCALELDGYPPAIAGAVADVAAYLCDLALPLLREVPLRVVHHDPCHARHGRGLVDEPRRLLRRIPGVELCEPEEAEVCCGSGGAYALLHPALSEAMGRRKARLLAETGADLVVTGNPGCLGQIRDGLACEAPDLPVLPLSDLLWYAALSVNQSD
jgi:glycolate oxidase iron-sulfur subunit